MIIQNGWTIVVTTRLQRACEFAAPVYKHAQLYCELLQYITKATTIVIVKGKRVVIVHHGVTEVSGLFAVNFKTLQNKLLKL